MHGLHRRTSTLLVITVLPWSILPAGCTAVPKERIQTQTPATAATHWWKGNLHTHTFWSDGNHYPEMVVDWYKRHGYHFLALTDHNVVPRQSKWIEAEKQRGGLPALVQFRHRFGQTWLDERSEDGKILVRLGTLDEFGPLFDQPGRFCLIQGEEITSSFQGDPVHTTAVNVRELLPPQKGSTMPEAVEKNVRIAIDHEGQTGQPVHIQLNHPNFGMMMTAEHIAQARNVRFFEVYNGIDSCRNYGDGLHASTDRIWDIVLTLRLTDGSGPLLYGVATDDAHDYQSFGPGRANPGKGWVMVRAERLDPDSLVKAMKEGDFYSSTGVQLSDVRFDGRRLRIQIHPEPGVTYKTQFIGTCKGYDTQTEPVTGKGKDGRPINGTQRYSKDVGKVFAEVPGTSPAYTLAGNEMYVRAKVISSKRKAFYQIEGETEMAWTQPVVPKAR